MKKTLTVMALCAAFTANAQTNETYETYETGAGIPQLFNAIEQATGWTPEEVLEGLDRVCRFYSNDVQRIEGRNRWHGKVVSVINDTNALTRTEIHEDGTEFVSRFTPAAPRSVASRLSDGQRRKIREERARKEKEARLEYLLAHEAEERARLEKEYPPLLAALLYTNSVNKARSAVSEYNPVTAPVTPQ